jgi:hypothetical protein
MRVSDDRYGHDFRSFHLALRMLKDEARTSTVSAWTGFSLERVRNLAKSHLRTHPSHGVERHRGPSPKQLAPLMVNPLVRSELAALGALCRILGVVPKERVPNARQRLPSIANGERLCTALELFRQVVPGAKLSLEQAVALAIALAEGDRWSLGHCEDCRGVVLLDRLNPRRPICVHCEKDRRERPTHESRDWDFESDDREQKAVLQQDLFPALTEVSSEGEKAHKRIVEGEQQPGTDREREHPPERERR